jgi:simple sugar transport system permease protein
MRREIKFRPLQVLSSLVPILALLLALLIGAGMLLALGANPLEGYAALIRGAFGNLNALADTLVKATSLLLVGCGICIAFRGGVFNLGGEGQYILGAIGASVLALAFPQWPSWAIIPAGLIAGLIGGGLMGLIAGLLKSRFGVNEMLSTIMLNQIAVQLLNYLLRGPMMDPVQIEQQSFIPQTARFSLATDLPRIQPTRLNLGFFIAVAVAVLVWLLLWKTTWGYRIRAVGLNPRASQRAGINVATYSVIALLLSGALAGLGGAVQVYGVNHRLLTNGSATGFTGNAGFNGIVAALFGQLHPLGTIPASILFGALIVGANELQRAVQVPSSLVTVLNGLVVIVVVGSEIWRRSLARKQEIQATIAQEEGPPKETPMSEKPEET